MLAVARITTHLANSSRNKILCSSCEMMLQKVESISTSHNKILICCSYYHTATICLSTNLRIHACDWLRSVTRQRARATLSMKRKTNNKNETTVLFEKQMEKNKSLLLLFLIISSCRVKDNARVKCKIQTMPMVRSNSGLAVEEIRQ